MRCKLEGDRIGCERIDRQFGSLFAAGVACYVCRYGLVGELKDGRGGESQRWAGLSRKPDDAACWQMGWVLKVDEGSGKEHEEALVVASWLVVPKSTAVFVCVLAGLSVTQRQ